MIECSIKTQLQLSVKFVTFLVPCKILHKGSKENLILGTTKKEISESLIKSSHRRKIIGGPFFNINDQHMLGFWKTLIHRSSFYIIGYNTYIN